jgi:DNA helicase-2/ATP-dependent DNA helicase PcrA
MSDVLIITSANDLGWDKSYHISAGPGAGKTHILVEHISNVLTKGKSCLGTNGKIACITYTNIAVETINKRLSDTADRIDVCTIHSFLFKNMVKPYLWILKEKPKYDLEQIENIEPWESRAPNDLINQWARGSRSLGSLQIQDKRKEVMQALKAIYWTISGDRKEELVVPKNHQWALVKDAKEQNKLIEWKSLLYSSGYMSYDDVLYFAWRIYRQAPALIPFISKKYPFIFVDEFQDTTPFQAELIDALKTEGKSTVLVIGDSHQSIFEFTGAKKERFDNYKNSADITPVVVHDNWRSSQKIISFLNRIRQDGLDQKPTSANKSKDFHAPVILLKGSAKDTKSNFFKLCDKYKILNDKKSRVILCRYENIKNYNFSWTKLFKSDEYEMGDPWDKFTDDYRSNMFQRLIESHQFYKKGDLINAHKRIEMAFRALRKQTKDNLPPYLPKSQEKRALYTKTLLWLNNSFFDEEKTVADFYNSFID